MNPTSMWLWPCQSEEHVVRRKAPEQLLDQLLRLFCLDQVEKNYELVEMNLNTQTLSVWALGIICFIMLMMKILTCVFEPELQLWGKKLKVRPTTFDVHMFHLSDHHTVLPSVLILKLDHSVLLWDPDPQFGPPSHRLFFGLEDLSSFLLWAALLVTLPLQVSR